MIERLVVGQLSTNCYLVNGIIIDPGDDAEYIISHIKTKPKMIVATHGHFDHIMAAYALQLAFNIPFYIHPLDNFLLRNMKSSARYFLRLKNIDPAPIPMNIDQAHISFIHTAGHTPGSICIYFKKEKVLFTGDTVFAGGALGRTDFSYSSKSDLAGSVRTILSIPPGTKLFPGHGESTTVRAEQKYHNLV